MNCPDHAGTVFLFLMYFVYCSMLVFPLVFIALMFLYKLLAGKLFCPIFAAPFPPLDFQQEIGTIPEEVRQAPCLCGDTSKVNIKSI